VLAVIAAGGVAGAEARWLLGLSAVPPPSFPWTTVVINVAGCLLIGVLMAVLDALTAPHRLVRPFLGVGVLGGFTTFSTYATDIHAMLVGHRPLAGVAYLVLTPMAALTAVVVGTHLTRTVLDRARRKRGEA
jgi:CrcB protein